jgi:uncharacterized Tic20 family protein
MASAVATKACPKCAYVRTESETVPDWQCPKCGIVYAKFGQAPPAASAPAPRRVAQAPAPAAEGAESTGLAKLAHASSLFNLLLPPLGTIVPIGIWIVKSGQDELAVDSAKEALNFQISIVLWAVGAFLPVLVFPPFIFVTSIVMVVLVIASLVMPVIATIRVSEGVRYYYPSILHIFGDGPGASLD